MARAEKHKTKYKESSIKDFKKSQKQEARKDLKDYTQEDKDGGMNPNSVGEAQTNVLRKRDKLVIDDVDNMVPKDKDVAKYYKVEGDHDPKYTKNEREKIQNEDETDNKKNIKDKIENLTREQKERLVREYVRRKIAKVLAEQSKPDFPDIDKDGDEEETAKKAAKDKKEKEQLNSSVVKEQFDDAGGEEEGGEEEGGEAPAPTPEPAPEPAPAPAPATKPEDDVTVNLPNKWVEYLTGVKGTAKTIDTAIKPLAKVLKTLDPTDKNIAKRQLNRNLKAIIRFLGSEEESA